MILMHALPRALRWSLVLIAVALITPAALAQADDPDAAALARARERYEAALAAVCADVERTLAAAFDAAPRAKDPVEALNLARQRHESFRSQGTLPDDKAKPRWLQEYARAAAELRRVQVAAVAAYSKAGRDDIAAAVTAELETLDGSWDLVPWHDLLPGGATPDPARTLNPGASPLSIGTPLLDREYRLELIFKGADTPAAFAAELPLPGGGRVSLPHVPVGSAGARVLLTVRNDHVSADLGLPRPLPTVSPRHPDAKGITLLAEGAPVEIVSARARPVIEGQPPDGRRSPPGENPGRNAADDPRADPFVAGKSWRGNFGDDIRTIRLVSRSGERVVFEVPGSFQGSMWKLEGRVRGNAAQIDSIDRIKNPPGHPPLKTRQPSGTIRIKGNGTLDMNCTVRGSDGRNNNWLGEFNCRNAEPM